MRKIFKQFAVIAIFFIAQTNGLLAQTATAPSLGTGTIKNPYQISSLENLYWIAASSDRWDDHYIQTATINASATSSWFSGKGWLPIGNSTTKFTGSYDGQNYEINNLFINRTGLSDNYIGLFGYVNGSSIIKNTKAFNINYTSRNDLGGIAGYNNGTIINCQTSGTISGRTRTGGIVGNNTSAGIIEGSYSSCSINGSSYEYHGGLVGKNDGKINSCFATGNVTGANYTAGLVGNNTGNINSSYSTGNVTGINYVSGLAGYNSGTIILSYSTSDVTGYNYIGGLVGYNAGDISFSYADIDGTKNITSIITSGTSSTGGFVGENSSAGTISNCYATVDILSTADGVYGGGFVSLNNGDISNSYCYSSILLDEEKSETVASGFVVINSTSGIISNSYTRGGVNAAYTTGFSALNDGGTISNCFWDGSTNNSTDSDGGTENTLTEMQTITTYTNAGWAFNCEIWGINGSSYEQCPFLLWQDNYGNQPNDCNYWTGSSSTSWSTSGNWSGGVPSSGDNVLIQNVSNDPIVGSTVSVGFVNVGTGALLTIGSAGDFTFTDRLVINGSVAVDPGGKLTATGTVENNKSYDGLVIKSTSSGSGSIILSTANVPATIERYAAGTQAFHLISTPVSGQSIRNFLNENSTVLAYNSTNNVYAMRHYIAGTGWASFYPPTQTGNVEPATTYAVGLASTGTLKFKGNLVTTNQTKSISDTGFGWNGIGNPFPSALNARVGTSSLLSKYGSLLNPSFYGLYIWDPASAAYQVINGVPLLSQDYIASAQGFIVKANTGGGSVIFETGMRAHQNPTFYKNEEEVEDWSNIILQVQNQTGKTLRTSFAFNQEMTSDLDIGFDAGLYTESTTYKFFSRMPGEKNDLDLTIQALPNTWEELVVLPLGLVYTAGGEVVFSINSMSLPEDILVKLEDKTLGTITDLLAEDYTVTVGESTNTTDRFFLHVVKKTTSVIDIDESAASINVFPNPSTGILKAQILLDKPLNVEFDLYDISGRKVVSIPRTLVDTGGQTLTIDSQNLFPGIYVLKIKGFESGSDLLRFEKGIKIVISRN